ncbi:MAG: GntR family transcriptional regulator [Acidobacteria bacterium]|nr:GntR family transcriptional regulator [Acidobacteriota bacterium]
MQRLAPDLRAETIADKVHALLGREIAAGAYRPAERIYEKSLAEKLGISRTPIREALLRLETEGVVVCNSRRSYNVRILTADDVREIYETLGILEGAAAGAVLGRLNGEDLEDLERLNQSMVEAAAAPDLPSFGRWNRQFHHVFLDKLDNTVLRKTCDLVRGPLYTFPVQRNSLADWLGKSVEEHRTIIQLAAAGDANALGAYFRDVHWNYERNKQYITDAFDSQGEAAVHL